MSWVGRPEWPRERLWLWRLGFPLVRAVATTLLPIDAEGRENVPQSGGYILVANHVTGLDPFWIEFALRERIRYMTKVEILGYPLIGGILRGIGNFPVRRGESDRRALETALRVLQAGQPLGFFPEGTRSRTGRLRRAKPGIAFLARRSGAPIVPVAITGSARARLRVPPRRDMHVRVGKPFTLADLAGPDRMDDQALADAIVRRIAELLPDEMKGEYAPVH
ncbi:MAG: lysophospholipid acyltransferase family protein [Candidatus Limnocylindria bacterium]